MMNPEAASATRVATAANRSWGEVSKAQSLTTIWLNEMDKNKNFATENDRLFGQLLDDTPAQVVNNARKTGLRGFPSTRWVGVNK